MYKENFPDDDGGCSVGTSDTCSDGCENGPIAESASQPEGNVRIDLVEQKYDRWTGIKGKFRPAAASLDMLPSGIWSAESDSAGLYFESKRFPSDAMLDLPGLPTRLILDEVKDFWEREHLFRKYGFLHKRGIMMCGPAGCGKTSIIRMVCNDTIKRGASFCSQTMSPSPSSV
jgi:hypothetical protein